MDDLLILFGVFDIALAVDCGGWLCPFSSSHSSLPDWALRRSGEMGDYCDIAVADAESHGMIWADKPFVVRGGGELMKKDSFSQERLLDIARRNGWRAKWGTSDSIIANINEGPVNEHMEKFIIETMRKPRYDTATNERLESPYVFQRFPGKNFKLPAVLQWLPWSDSFFFLGAEGSGVSWHRHNAAVQEGVYGWKRWLLLPPSRPPAGGGIGFWSILEWVKVVLPTLQGSSRPLECIVGPGDVIYVPENWFHAILNVRGDSVSVSLQASKSVTEHKKLFDAMLTERDISRRIPLLQNIASLTPQDLDTHFSLARLYLQSGDHHSALDSFKAIIRQDPFRIDAMYKVFEYVVDQKKAKRKELLDALLPFEPLLANSTDRSLMANYILAVVYRLTKNNEKELDKLSRNADLQKSGTWFGTNLPQHNFSKMLVKAHRRISPTADEL